LFDLPQAITSFQTAIDLDPTYAPAHAGLALAYCAQAELRVAPHATAYAPAKVAALRALAMDNDCADAQVALGSVLYYSEWDWEGAERSLTRALALNPQHTEAMLIYGRLLETFGQLERGLAMKQKALDRDPLSPLVYVQIAQSYWNQRRYDEAIDWANKALDVDPRHLLAREFLSAAYWRKGDFDRMFAEAITHAEAYGAQSDAISQVRQVCADVHHAYATGGRPAVVALMLQQVSEQPHGGPPIQLAVLSGEAGELDAAFRHLGRAINGRDPCLVHLAVAPQWDSLRGDPRFAEVLSRMGLK
jgi:tetratricopeptide (TPR) repeat protein